jgi:hypothetical protein
MSWLCVPAEAGTCRSPDISKDFCTQCGSAIRAAAPASSCHSPPTPVFAETTGGYFSVSGAERRGRNQPNRRRKGRRRLRAVRSVVPESMWAAILEELEQLEQHSQVLDIGTD